MCYLSISQFYSGVSCKFGEVLSNSEIFRTRFIYAFDDEIRAEIESAILTTINTWAGKLDALLMELPRSLPIDDTSAIDVALVEDPFLGPNFLTVCANGEFVSLKKPNVPPQPGHSLHPGIVCSELEKMVTIAISDYVINSAAKVYFEVCSSLLELIMFLVFGFPFLPFHEPLGV
jgi:hypothetical protein